MDETFEKHLYTPTSPLIKKWRISKKTHHEGSVFATIRFVATKCPDREFWKTMKIPEYIFKELTRHTDYVTRILEDTYRCITLKDNPKVRYILNGRERTLPSSLTRQTHNKIVEFHNPTARDPDGYTVTYRCEDERGVLNPGRYLHIRDGMIINATRTNNA